MYAEVKKMIPDGLETLDMLENDPLVSAGSSTTTVPAKSVPEGKRVMVRVEFPFQVTV